MYSEHLTEQTLPIDQIFLDSNNPRFWSEKGGHDIADKKIPEDKMQASAFNRIQSFGVVDLRNSILRNGFLPLDRIVVRPLTGVENAYVAVEGNRRLAALLTLRQEIEDGTVSEDGIDEDYLSKICEDTNYLTVLVYEGDDSSDISWLLQGVRHISGIREWEPAQRARLLVTKIDEEGMNFTAAGQTFGLSARAVGRLYRAFKALEQMRKNDEFGSKAKNEYFTLFDEAYKNTTVRKWLQWNEEEQRFDNTDDLLRFYSWIVPDDEHPDQNRRIHDPRQIKELGYLISADQKELLDQVDQHEMTVGEAFGKAQGMESSKDWKDRLQKAYNHLANLPTTSITENPEDFLDAVGPLIEELEKRKKMAESIIK